MSFRTADHDVTCLCALVDLPCAVIVEELPAAGRRARFQLQAFTQGAVGELLEWMEPVLRRARVRRWEGMFAMARVEVPEGAGAENVRAAVRAVAAAQDGELHVAVSLRAEEAPPRARLASLVRALGA